MAHVPKTTIPDAEWALQAVQRMADLEAQVARLEAAIKAKDAVLVDWLLADGSYFYVLAGRAILDKMRERTRAALSPDAGEGRLPPEVKDLVRELQEAGEELCLVADTPVGKRIIGQRVGRSGEYVQVTLKLSEIRRFRDALAALDALEVK